MTTKEATRVRTTPWVGGPTPEIRDAIAGAIETLMIPLTHAASKAGLHPRTARRWLEQGDKDIDAGLHETPHALFAHAVACARSAKVETLVTEIRAIAKQPSAITGLSDPKPLMWMLERTEPEFKSKTEVEQRVEIAADPKTELGNVLAKIAAAVAPKTDEEA